jgi:hypothetical protein
MEFNSRSHGAWFCLLLAVAASLAVEARADEAIGVASVVRNNVSGVLPSGAVQIDSGASVVRNEIVKTAEDSSTKLVFTDSTNLAIGPSSTVKLNNFVAAGPSTYGKATIDVAKGVFRFTTGHSDKRAYEINTGVATIGVRGTIFEGEMTPQRVRLHVVDGIVNVRTKNGRFCELRAGQSAMITDLACALIVGFNPGFSSEFTDVQEFSALHPGEEGLIGLENPAMYALPAVAGAGAVAGGVAARVSNSSSNGGGSSSQQNQLNYLLLLNNGNHPASP